MFYPGRWTAAMMVVLRVGSIFAFSYFIHYHALRLSLQLGDAFFHFTEQAKSRQIFTCGFEDTLPLPCLCPPFPSRPDFIVSFFSCAFSCVVLQISVIIMDWKRARRERERVEAGRRRVDTWKVCLQDTWDHHHLYGAVTVLIEIEKINSRFRTRVLNQKKKKRKA